MRVRFRTKLFSVENFQANYLQRRIAGGCTLIEKVWGEVSEFAAAIRVVKSGKEVDILFKHVLGVPTSFPLAAIVWASLREYLLPQSYNISSSSDICY